MLSVLQGVTHMNRGGIEKMQMKYQRHKERDKVQLDLLTHGRYEGD